MPKVPKSVKQGRPRKGAARSSTAHLDKLIEEATVDCYNESEEITGLFKKWLWVGNFLPNNQGCVKHSFGAGFVGKNIRVRIGLC